MFPRHSTLPLGGLLGIELRVHWSLFVVFAVIAVNLAGGVFPAWHPRWDANLVWTVAFATTVLFFASILAHELSHALVARYFGIPVRSVTLFLFGGIANLDDEPDSAKKEVLMAGVGPLVSIALGLLFIVSASMVTGPAEPGVTDIERLSDMGPLATLLAWLGPINVFIGLFNLLPGFPLDGGRILRAGLWWLLKDLTRATRWASRAGRVMGGLLVALGFLMMLGSAAPAFGSRLVSGLWVMLIGWFLYSAATLGYKQLLAKTALIGTPVKTLMRRLPSPVPRDISVDEWVREHVLPTGAEEFVVVDEKAHVVGIARASAAHDIAKEHWPATPVSAVTKGISQEHAISADSDSYEAYRKLQRAEVSAMPVVDAEKPVGAFGMAEVTRWLRITRDDRTSAHSKSWGDYVPGQGPH